MLTLHDANMLCNVTQTATTLNTGDHSFPNIEAHICWPKMMTGGHEFTAQPDVHVH